MSDIDISPVWDIHSRILVLELRLGLELSLETRVKVGVKFKIGNVKLLRSKGTTFDFSVK